MKFIGSFIIIALFNLLTVFAGPPPAIFTKDKDFEYYLISDIAHIVDVLDKTATTITIPPYVKYNGKNYNVSSLTSGLSDSKVQKIIVSNDIKHEFALYTGLSDAKYLKAIQIDAPNVLVFEHSFDNVNPDIDITGDGVENMIKFYSKIILDYNDIDVKKYDHESTTDDKQCDIYQIAKFVKKNFTYNTDLANASNAVNTLLFKQGNSLGLARAIRILAGVKGFDMNDIQVGGDDLQSGWNYVKFGSEWYTLDIVHTEFKDEDSCASAFLVSNDFNSN